MTARYPVVLNGATIQELQIGDTLAGQAASGTNSDITSLTGLTTALTVAQGGTGAITLTGILKGNGTGAVTAITAPTGTLVGTTDTQTLTNKTLTGLAETKVAMSANVIDLSSANIFTKTITTAATFTISNTAATGSASTFILDLTNGGSSTVTWFTGAKWAGGTAPTLTVSGRDLIGAVTHDGGVTWSCTVIAKDLK